MANLPDLEGHISCPRCPANLVVRVPLTLTADADRQESGRVVATVSAGKPDLSVVALHMLNRHRVEVVLEG